MCIRDRPFLVVLHLGTAVALMLFFWRDWWNILAGLMAKPSEERESSRKILLLVVIATLPAAILGFLFEHRLKHLFGVPIIAAGFLFANGFVLFVGERLRKRQMTRATINDLRQLDWRGALSIGLWQCTAFLPGISRSGATCLLYTSDAADE